jgi:hypothetical protein
MGKHADDDNKLVFLVYLQYVTVRRSNLGSIVAKDLKARAGATSFSSVLPSTDRRVISL